MVDEARTTPDSPAPYRNGDVAFWYADGGPPQRRPALPGSTSADVCIVGAGYTGLWTAYYLKRLQPDLRVVVLEKEFAGYGASGRNGGWLSGELSGSRRRYAATHGRDAVIALQREMFAAVDEVIDVAQREGIDADIDKGGLLLAATSPAQEQRLHAGLAEDRRWGLGEDEVRLLSAEEQLDRIRVRGARAMTFRPNAARIQPAKLVRGLASAVESLGVRICEGTRVQRIEPGRAVTEHGVVTADHIIRATEGFTPGLNGHRRTWLPMNSSMIVTQPLPESFWERIGWAGNELLGDMAHAYIYAQRTPDSRIALGGRGVPYLFGSRWDESGRTHERTVEELRQMMTTLFGTIDGLRVEHTWSGTLGVPRDWCATVTVDRSTGLGWAGGYVGHGVTTSNLAGRTLSDLILRRETDLCRLPWVDRRVRTWEPEPLRWLGVKGMYVLYRAADRREHRGLRSTSRIARLANLISGR
jgi:glycine/D-amino acid oxidase-like deaminating enzyme